MHTVDYAVVLIFMMLMVVIGITTKSTSKNISDYIRMGNKSTWWMAGLSLFMSSFSAATFTGIAGQAFIAGWSVIIVQLSSTALFFIQAIFIAKLFRRTRAVTPLDAVRARFGPAAEAVKSYVGLLSAFFFSGFFLLGFATFASSLLGIPMWQIVIGTGVVVVFYSVSGGSWSVQITDSLQAIILIPGTIAVALLSLHAVGWFDGLFTGIRELGLTSDYQMIKSPDHEYMTGEPFKIRAGNFTMLWLAGMLIQTVINAVNLSGCYRYLSLKDEKSAEKAAWLAGSLFILGSVIFILPAIVGRILFHDQIAAVTGIPNPADAAYTVTAMNLVPPGILGFIFVFMLAATMSSMDSFLTGTAGYIVRNIYQPMAGVLRWRPLSDTATLKLTRFVNLSLGMFAIVMAFVLDKIGGDTGMFEVMQTILTVVGAPTALPFALSIFVKRIPLWGLFAGIGCGIVTSIALMVARAYDFKLEWGYETMLMSAVCILPTLFSTLFWKHTSQGFRERVDAFFETINTPVNVKNEVGASADKMLLKTVGRYSLVAGACMLILCFWAKTTPHLVAILGISGSMLVVGSIMMGFGSRKDPQSLEA